jgi:hypothetical protein
MRDVIEGNKVVELRDGVAVVAEGTRVFLSDGG